MKVLHHATSLYSPTSQSRSTYAGQSHLHVHVTRIVSGTEPFIEYKHWTIQKCCLDNRQVFSDWPELGALFLCIRVCFITKQAYWHRTL